MGAGGVSQPPVRSFRQRFSLGVTLLAWFIASGSQWDVVQVFAWARMFVANTETLSLGDAVVRTFSPEARCGLCNAVSAAKQQRDTPATPGPRLEDKAFLVCEPVPVIVAVARPRATSQPDDQRLKSAGKEPPPLRPPRGC
jgi:hypothetical protein